LPLVVWVLVQTGPWHHFPGFRWYALPLPPPPLLLACLLLLARQLLHSLLLALADLLPPVLLHLLVPVYPDFAHPPLPPLAVSHLSRTFPPLLPLLLARALLHSLILTIADFLPLVLLHPLVLLYPLVPVYPDFAHPPLPPLAVSHLSQTFPPLLPAPLHVRRLQM
jgi:hypothetical protein